MLNERNPSPISSGVKLGLPPISPQTDTGLRMRNAASVANWIRRRTEGCRGSYNSATSLSPRSTASV